MIKQLTLLLLSFLLVPAAFADLTQIEECDIAATHIIEAEYNKNGMAFPVTNAGICLKRVVTETVEYVQVGGFYQLGTSSEGADSDIRNFSAIATEVPATEADQGISIIAVTIDIFLTGEQVSVTYKDPTKEATLRLILLID